MKYIKYKLKGSFGQKEINVKIYYAQKKTSHIAVFFHWAYSSTLKKKYFQFARQLCTKANTHVVLYETSRDYSYAKFERKGITFQEYEKTFTGKTFQHELHDVRRVVSFVHDHFKAIKKPRLHFIGMSMGAMLASCLIKDHQSLLHTIILIGSGYMITGAENRPILNSLPNTILQNYRSFLGNITILHGENDKVLSKEQSIKIFLISTKSNNKKLIWIKGADHRFITIDNKPAEKKLNKQLLKIIINEIIG